MEELHKRSIFDINKVFVLDKICHRNECDKKSVTYGEQTLEREAEIKGRATASQGFKYRCLTYLKICRKRGEGGLMA